MRERERERGKGVGRDRENMREREREAPKSVQRAWPHRACREAPEARPGQVSSHQDRRGLGRHRDRKTAVSCLGPLSNLIFRQKGRANYILMDLLLSFFQIANGCLCSSDSQQIQE